MMRRTLVHLLLLCIAPSSLLAQLSPEYLVEEPTEAELIAAYQYYADSVESSLTFYVDTTIILEGGLAELAIPQGYMYVDGADARTVLVELWGNPPEMASGSMGMLFPQDNGPASEEGYGIDIFFSDEGYISDEDAHKMDYDDLLEQMQDDILAGNEARRDAGYAGMNLVDWAAPPHYDAANKRLHWAKELAFDDTEENTLNYNVLFLGRRGYLTMNVIGGMKDVAAVSDDLDGILQSVSYLAGHRYSDYQPGTDRVAAYGIGALIAGKVLAKTGFLALIGVFLLKAWKIVLIGVIAVGAGAKKIFGK